MASGHSMIVKGHKNVAEGWRMFKEAVDDSMPGELHQLLRHLKEKITPTPPHPLWTLAKQLERHNLSQERRPQ